MVWNKLSSVDAVRLGQREVEGCSQITYKHEYLRVKEHLCRTLTLRAKTFFSGFPNSFNFVTPSSIRGPATRQADWRSDTPGA